MLVLSIILSLVVGLTIGDQMIQEVNPSTTWFFGQESADSWNYYFPIEDGINTRIRPLVRFLENHNLPVVFILHSGVNSVIYHQFRKDGHTILSYDDIAKQILPHSIPVLFSGASEDRVVEGLIWLNLNLPGLLSPTYHFPKMV